MNFLSRSKNTGTVRLAKTVEKVTRSALDILTPSVGMEFQKKVAAH